MSAANNVANTGTKTAALEITGLQAWYGESHILHDVNLKVNRGEVVTILGRNGAGRTTTMRAMESSFTAEKLLKPSEGWTNHFIHPPYEFNIADSLVTNFHLPKTSLLIMTCAFAGYELTMEAYKKAIKDKYRFFSYGDALLIV